MTDVSESMSMALVPFIPKVAIAPVPFPNTTIPPVTENYLGFDNAGYIHTQLIAKCVKSLTSTSSEERLDGVRMLVNLYNEHKDEMSYYRQVQVLTVLAEHGNGVAKKEYKLINGCNGDRAGFDALTLSLDVKKWEDLDHETFQPYNDLMNRAAEAITYSREKLQKELEAHVLKRDKRELIKAEKEAKLAEEDEGSEEGGGAEETNAIKMSVQIGVPRLIKTLPGRMVTELDLEIQDAKEEPKFVFVVVMDGNDELRPQLELLGDKIWEKCEKERDIEAQNGSKKRVGAQDEDQYSEVLVHRPKRVMTAATSAE